MKLFACKLITYSQELVLALAWLSFAFLSTNAPIINVLEDQYVVAADIFHFGFAVAGVLMLIAIAKPHIFFSAWVYSAVVSASTLIASLGVDTEFNSGLYPFTWALFLLLSVTQAMRHYGGSDERGD